MGNLATAVGTSSVASDSDTSGSVRKTVRLDVNQEQVHQILQQINLTFEDQRAITLETVYKVAICPRGNLPYKQIYFTNDILEH